MRSFRSRALVAVVLLTTSAAACAQAHKRADEAMSAMSRKDCPTVLAALKQGMLDNEPMSFLMSGTLAETGTCVEVDPGAAAKAYERGALLGDRDAAASLAKLHAEGSGVPQSYREAGRWYAIASTGSASAGGDAAAFERPDVVARTYVRAVHDLAYWELVNRLKYPYPLGLRVRFDPVTGGATIVARKPGAGPREMADAEVMTSYREALQLLPNPTLPAGDFATERTLGADDGAP